MSVKSRYYTMLSVFILSVFLSICSYFTTLQGKGEIYPFFFWKLFTRPLGHSYHVKDYRLYGVNRTDTLRIDNKGYELFDKDDYYYFVSGEASWILKREKPYKFHKQRINDFAQSLGLNFATYLVVEESYNPLEIIKEPKNYKQKIIFSTSESYE